MTRPRCGGFAVAALALLAGCTEGRPQDADTAVASNSRWEFRFTSGKLVPTGTQRDVLEKQCTERGGKYGPN